LLEVTVDRLNQTFLARCATPKLTACDGKSTLEVLKYAIRNR